MGKRIIQQARGHGSLTYRVRSQAYVYRLGYPIVEGKAKVVKLINSPAHSAPIAKIEASGKVFFTPAVNGLVEGQDIEIGGKQLVAGNILELKDIPVGTQIFFIECKPRDGGKLVRTSGSSAAVTKKGSGKIGVLLPSRKEVFFDEKCRASVGVIAGAGRLDKPMMKAGTMWHKMKARNKLWPRTSAIKMNVIDHPFGSGRGKRPKSKIAKRNAPPGARVGHLRPSRTGRRKR